MPLRVLAGDDETAVRQFARETLGDVGHEFTPPPTRARRAGTDVDIPPPRGYLPTVGGAPPDPDPTESTSNEETTMARRLIRLPIALLAAAALAGPAAAQDAPAPDMQATAERPGPVDAPTLDDAVPRAGDPGAVSERAPVDIREWEVPWEGRPRDPYVRDRSRVWFVGQRTHYVGYLSPASGEFEKYDLEDGTGPHNLIVDEDGTVWYAGNRAAHIGRLDPETGEVERIEMPNPEARDPHTLVFDPAGDIWFTVQGGNFIGKLDVDTREVDLVEVPTEGARPYGIVTDDSGRPWIAMVGTYKLATVDPETMELREIELPREDARPRRIALTSDGKVWYVDYAQGRLGRYDPETGEIREWMPPGGADTAPYGMASDGERLWFVQTRPSPNRFVGFDPDTEEFFSVTEVPSGGGTVRHMYYHAPEEEVWFGADSNTIGRAAVGEVSSGGM
jgi:virginiamycin B lyase